MSVTLDEYEEMAAEFYCDTGLVAPGKDQAAAGQRESYETRSEAWAEWLRRRAITEED